MDEKTAQKLCVIYLLHFLIKIHIASCCITNKYLKIECVRHDYIVNNYCSEKANLPYNDCTCMCTHKKCKELFTLAGSK